MPDVWWGRLLGCRGAGAGGSSSRQSIWRRGLRGLGNPRLLPGSSAGNRGSRVPTCRCRQGRAANPVTRPSITFWHMSGVPILEFWYWPGCRSWPRHWSRRFLLHEPDEKKGREMVWFSADASFPWAPPSPVRPAALPLPRYLPTYLVGK